MATPPTSAAPEACGVSELDSSELKQSLQAVPEVQLILCVCENVRTAERDLFPILRRGGYGVDALSTDRYSAVRLLARPYRLVVFDISSRDGPGYEMCQRTRPNSDLPLVMVLRGAARTEVLKGYQMGADAHVLAPIDSRELIARISALLRRRPPKVPQQ